MKIKVRTLFKFILVLALFEFLVYRAWEEKVFTDRMESEGEIMDLFGGEVSEPAGADQFNHMEESQKPTPTPKPQKTFSGPIEKTCGNFFGLNLNMIAEILIKVESDGRLWLVGDKHLRNKAYGPLQVRKPVLDEVNPILKTHYTPEQMNGNKELSVKVWKTYVQLWATPKRLDHKPTLEEVSRIWNGGPNGYKKQSTIPYWNKTQKVVHKQKAESFLALNK